MRFKNELLLKLRQGKRWSRADLAKASGVSAQAIWKIESGLTASPRLSIVELLAAALGVSPQVFFEGVTHKSKGIAAQERAV